MTNPDLTWLNGCRIKDVEKNDYTWFFALDDGSTIATESPWRLITTERIEVTSEDDGHLFGLPAPVEAASRVKEAIGQDQITRFELRERTCDLLLHFTNGAIIEFLNLSCGYEAWRTSHGSQLVYCLGGGGCAVFGER